MTDFHELLKAKKNAEPEALAGTEEGTNERQPSAPVAAPEAPAYSPIVDEPAPEPEDDMSMRRPKKRKKFQGQRRDRDPRKRQPDQAPEQRDPVDIAREIFVGFQADAYPILYRPDIERDSVDKPGEQEDIPSEEWSYAAIVRQVETEYLRFEFIDEAKAIAQGKRPAKKIRPAATIEDHATGRMLIEQLLTTSYQAHADRLDQVIQTTRARWLEHPQAEAIGKAIVKTDFDPVRRRKTPVSLDTVINRAQTNLATLRWEAMMDVVDWFKVHINELETRIKIVTQNDGQRTLDQRIAALDNNPELETIIKQLEEDLAVFEAGRTFDMTSISDKDKQKLKSKLEKQVNYARRCLERAKRQIGNVKKFAEPNEKTGLTHIDYQKQLIAEAFMMKLDDSEFQRKIGGKFIIYADSQLRGMSPEEELNFWRTINDLFDSIEPRPHGKPGSQDLKAAVTERLRKINEQLKIYDKKLEAGKTITVIVHSEDKAKLVGDDEYPIGVEQIMRKAISDAILLGELRAKMVKTFAIMGIEFRKAVERALRGRPNAEKIDVVEMFNTGLDKQQDEAVTALGKIAKIPAEASEEQKTALTAANALAQAFKDAMGGKKPGELNYKDPAQNALKEKIRVQVFRQLELGTPKEIKRDRIRELLNPVDEEDKEAREESEREAAAARPLFDQILKLTISPEIAAGVQKVFDLPEPATPLAISEWVAGQMQRLTVALQSGPVRDVMEKKFELFTPADGVQGPQGLQDYLMLIHAVVLGCERLKNTLGTNWVKEVGVLAAVNERGRRPVNEESIQTAFVNLAAETELNFPDVLQLDLNPQAVQYITNKIEAQQRDAFARLGIVNEDTTLLLLGVLPRTEKQEDVPIGTVARRMLHYLELGRGDVKGTDLLVQKQIIVIRDGENEYQLDKIAEIARSQQYDQAA